MNNEICFSKVIGQINNDLNKLIEKSLDKKEYNHSEARVWTNQIVQKALKFLSDFNSNFKYIVNCVIMQKSECSLSINRSVLWDADLDGEATINYENDEILCVLNIYGISI